MKKASTKRVNDDLRPEYDLTQLTGGVRGKYYRQAVAGTNLMLIEPELAEVFRDSESVNRALRLLVDTAEAAARPAGRRHRVANKASQRTAQKARRR
jgi:predicted aminopeptidase